ncbi:MAG: peptidylprolyl isomerase [Christensenellales bacterium]|jgi:hypothetical protein
MKKTTIKKFALMLMFLLSFSFILTGCTLFEKNLSKYYNTVVTTIHVSETEKIDITKRELITAFNNYGVNLVQQSGKTVEEAMRLTLNQLVNQKLLLREAGLLATYTNADKNKLWEDSTNSLNSFLKTYVEEVEKAWGIENAGAEEAKAEESVVKYTPYSKKVELVRDGNKLLLRLLNQETEEQTEDLKYTQMQDVENKEVIVDALYNYLTAKTVFSSENENLTPEEKYQRQVARVNAEAVRRLANSLKQSEKGLRLSTDNASVIKRALERIYQNTLDNLKLNKISKIITPTIENSRVTVSAVLKQYESMLRQSYEKYSLNPSALDSEILSSFANVNYTNTTKYFFVSHILLKFTDAQKAEYTSIQERAKTGEISPLEKQMLIDQLIANIKAVVRDEEGKVVENTNIYSNNVLDEITRKLGAASTKEQKAQEFRNLLYKYNQDDGALNSEYLYVIGEENSQMVESFTKAARELHTAGEFGGISGLVPSEYGVHILFYAGKVTDTIPFQISDIDNFSLQEEDIWQLNNTLLNPLNVDPSVDKTLLDKVFEKFVESSQTSDQAMYLNTLKQDMKIERFPQRYKDLIS